MKRKLLLLCCGGLALIALSAFIFSSSRIEGAISGAIASAGDVNVAAYAEGAQRPISDGRFEVQILVDGRPLDEYDARGKSYVEASAGAEYEVRIRNPLPYRVAVALSVDGLNTIDARHTTAWNASKWVIEPYGTINISGWQMSSERARRFLFYFRARFLRRQAGANCQPGTGDRRVLPRAAAVSCSRHTGAAASTSAL